MTIWEYNVIEKWGLPFTNQEMNAYGEEGWELVTVIPSYETVKGTFSEALRYFIYKRQKEG